MNNFVIRVKTGFYSFNDPIVVSTFSFGNNGIQSKSMTLKDNATKEDSYNFVNESLNNSSKLIMWDDDLSILKVKAVLEGRWIDGINHFVNSKNIYLMSEKMKFKGESNRKDENLISILKQSNLPRSHTLSNKELNCLFDGKKYNIIENFAKEEALQIYLFYMRYLLYVEGTEEEERVIFCSKYVQIINLLKEIVRKNKIAIRKR